MTSRQDQMTETFDTVLGNLYLCLKQCDVLQNGDGHPVQGSFVGQVRPWNEKRTR